MERVPDESVSERPSIPAFATWEMGAQQHELRAPRRFLFDALAARVGRQIPALRVLALFDGTMPAAARTATKILPARLFDGWLRGASQVVIVNNPVCGAFILAAVLVPSTSAGLHGLLGLTGATAAALLLRLDPHAFQSGLFGYNGLLVGMGAAASLARDQTTGWDPAIAIAVLLVSALSTFLQLTLGNALVPTFKSPPFTLAFNLAYILLVLSAASFSHINVADPTVAMNVSDQVSDLSSASTSTAPDDAGDVVTAGATVTLALAAALRAVGQIFLCESTLSGALIITGAVSPPPHA
jgi:urea transporter